MPCRLATAAASRQGDAPAVFTRGRGLRGARGLSGRQHHDHLAAFEFRLLLDLGHGGYVVAHPVKQLEAKLLVGHLAATKTQRDLDLVALVEEPPDRTHFHVIIVIIDHRPELNFLDLDDLLFLARLGSLLLFLVLKFTEIEDLAGGGGHVGGDFDEIESRLQRNVERITEGNDAAVCSSLVDQLHLSDANVFVDARAVLGDGQRYLHGTTNGENLLDCFQDTLGEILGLRRSRRGNLIALLGCQRRSGELVKKSTPRKTLARCYFTSRCSAGAAPAGPPGLELEPARASQRRIEAA